MGLLKKDNTIKKNKKEVDKMEVKKNKNWIKRHPVWTVIICIVLFIFFIALLGSGSETVPKDIDVADTIDTTVEDTQTEPIETTEEEQEEEIEEDEEDKLDADASDGTVHLWLIDKYVDNEKCIFLDREEECHVFKIKIQNNYRDSITTNPFMWEGWIGDEGINANTGDGPDRIRKDGTAEVEIYFKVKIGQTIDELVFMYGLFNEIILEVS